MQRASEAGVGQPGLGSAAESVKPDLLCCRREDEEKLDEVGYDVGGVRKHD